MFCRSSKVQKRFFFQKIKSVFFVYLRFLTLFKLYVGYICVFVQLQNWMDKNSEWGVMRMLPKILLSVLVFLSGDFYQKTVIFLNDKGMGQRKFVAGGGGGGGRTLLHNWYG